jgi:anti-sigma-K factor RskA
MARLDPHPEIQQLLGAYALDAVSAQEAEEVERHLATCARCRAEVADHREVAGLLGYAAAPAPEGVWDRIASQLDQPAPPLQLSRFRPGGASAGSAALNGSPANRPERPLERRRRVQTRIVAALAAAALVAVAVLGVEVARLDHRTDQLPAAVTAQGKRTAWRLAVADPGARRVTLVAPDARGWVQAVVLANGTSFLGPTNLPRLSNDQTYQLWGMVGGVPISLGVLGPDPSYQPFITPVLASALAISQERAGGVVAPTRPPVVAATLS